MKRLVRPKKSIRVSAIALAKILDLGEAPFSSSRKTRYCLIACKKESCSLLIGNKQEVLQQNEVLIVPPTISWSIGFGEENIYPPIIFDGFLKTAELCSRVFSLSSLSGNIFKELILSLSAKTAFKEKEILLLISQLEYFLNSLAVSLIDSKVKSDDYAIFTEGVRYIKDNLDKDVSINHLAAYLCVSSSKLKRVFSKYSALSLHKFMLAVKTEKAKELLKSGLSSKEVSRHLGFENQNYFSAVFKRETGKSPSAYCSGSKE